MDLQAHPQNGDHQRPCVAVARPRDRGLGLHPGQVPQGPGQRQGLLARGRRLQLQEVAGRPGRQAHGQPRGRPVRGRQGRRQGGHQDVRQWREGGPGAGEGVVSEVRAVGILVR